MQRENKRTKLLTRRAAMIGGAKVGLLGALAARLYYLQVMQADRYSMLADENRINLRLLAPPRGLHHRPFRRRHGLQPPELPGGAGGGAGRRSRFDPRRGGGPDLDLRERPPPRAARDPPQAQLRAGGGAREPDLGRDGSHRGQRAGAAGRLDRAGPDPQLSPGRDGLPRRRIRGGGVGEGTHRRSPAGAPGFPHRQERRREDPRHEPARQGRHQPGRGQRLRPRGARALPRRGNARRRGDAHHRCGPAAIRFPALRRRGQRCLRRHGCADRRRPGDGVGAGL